MKRILPFLFVSSLFVGFCNDEANADHYRVHLRAYRRMMHQLYPSPFAQRFWGFVDNNVLQENGLLERLLGRLIAQAGDGPSDQRLTAQNSVTVNEDLREANRRMDAVLFELGLTVPISPDTEPITDNFDTPVNDAGFESPAQVPGYLPQ